MKPSPLLWLLQSTWRSVELLDDVFRGVFSGFWLGVLTRRHVHAIGSHHYDQPDSHHSREHNRSGLFPWEAMAIATHFADCRSLVLLGAGAGRECAALVDRGLEVDGFECHDGLRTSGAAIFGAVFSERCLQPMAPDVCPKLHACYDGAILGWGLYTLIQGRPRRIQLLADLRSACRPGAPLLLSFFVRGGSRRPYRIGAAMANIFRSALSREPVEYGDHLSPNFAHFFSQEELEGELRDGGWRVEEFNRRAYPHAVAIAEPRPSSRRNHTTSASL